MARIPDDQIDHLDAHAAVAQGMQLVRNQAEQALAIVLGGIAAVAVAPPFRMSGMTPRFVDERPD